MAELPIDSFSLERNRPARLLQPHCFVLFPLDCFYWWYGSYPALESLRLAPEAKYNQQFVLSATKLPGELFCAAVPVKIVRRCVRGMLLIFASWDHIYALDKGSPDTDNSHIQ